MGEDDVQFVSPAFATPTPKRALRPQPQPQQKKKNNKRAYNKNIGQSMSDAEKAASDSVDIMKNGTSEKAKKKRAILRNEEDVNSLDDLSKQLASNGKQTMSLAATIEKVLTQPTAVTTSHINSPSTKHMEKISLYQDHLDKLRESRKKLVADKAEHDEIAEVDEEIQQYKEMKKSLNKKLFAAANAKD